jgi:WD40 repeat protein/predicted Ser/Thr protein kinase
MNPSHLASETSGTCSRCGAARAAGAPAGLCPHCELQGALDLCAEPLPPSRTEPGPTGPTSPTAEASAAFPRHFGDYELLEEIARGGMGVVYRARQRSLDRIVAVKMLLSGPLASREFIQRFRIEAAAAASLRHPNIVAIHEVGVQAGQQFFAMDFIAGRTLAEAISRQPLPPRRAATLLQTVAEAIHHAHEHGILHRDLKPSNVILDAEDQPHITDFGLAKRCATPTQATALPPCDLTLSGQVLGSPSYMPPEQAATKRGKLGRPSDVYALGAMLYHALTGRPPFVGATLAETLQALLNTDPVRPRLLHPAVPADLETICLKCLEKEPARRYATARELADELGRWLRGEPIQARPAGRAERLWRWCGRQPALAALSGAVLLLLVLTVLGSVVAALRLKQQEQSLRLALREASLAEAHFRRRSGEAGQRFESLAALGRAAAIKPSLDLRNEAIAALTVPDLRELDRIVTEPGAGMVFDNRLTMSAEWRTPGKEPGQIIVRRIADRRELARLPLAVPSPLVALSPDGRFVAQLVPGRGATSRIEVWDVATGTPAFDTDVPARGFPVDFHPDGRRAAFGQMDGRILLVDLVARSETGFIEAGLTANRLRFHPGSQHLAAAKLFEPEVLVFHLADGAMRARLPQPGGAFTGLDWSANGERLAVACVTDGGEHLVQLWEWRDGSPKPAQALRGHRGAIVRVAFVPESELLWSGSWDGTTRLWSASTGRELLASPWPLAQDGIATNRVAFEQAGATFAITELVAGREHRLLGGPPVGAGAGVTSVDFSPDGKLVASAGPDGVRLWHSPSGRLLGRLPVGASASAVFAPHKDGLWIAEVGKISHWPLRANAAGHLTVGPPEVLTDMKRHGTELRLALNGDGTRLAVGSGAKVEVLDLSRNVSLAAARHNLGLPQVAFSADGAWVVASGGGRCKVWHADNGVLAADWPAGGYASAAFSPDGRWLVASGRPQESQDGLHQIRRVCSWETVREFQAVGGVWSPGVFSPDGRLLALRISRSGIRLLETRAWSELATFDVPDQELACALAFSRDGARLAVACETRLVHCWDLREVRQSLARLGLDWDEPPYPPAAENLQEVPPLVLLPGAR